MLIETTAGELRLALDKVRPAIQRRNTIPVLGSVLLENGSVTGTDLDMEIRIKFATKTCKGAAAIPFFQLHGLVSRLAFDKDIRIQTTSGKETGVFVTFEGGRYSLPTHPVSDFPRLSMPTGMRALVSPEGLRSALEKCKPFVSTEETRYYLNGVCFSRDNDGTPCLIATDGHRLIAHQYLHDCNDNQILPRHMLAALLTLPEPKKVFVSKLHMEFVLPGGSYLRTKLIDGKFPDWTRVVPTIPEGSPRLKFNPLEMISVLSRLEIGRLGGGKKHASAGIDFCANASGDLVVATSRGLDFEECTERLESASTSDWDKMKNSIWSCNSAYLKELCRLNKHADECVVTAEDQGSPTRFEGENTKIVMVIMPMRGGHEFTRQSLLTLARTANGGAAKEAAA